MNHSVSSQLASAGTTVRVTLTCLNHLGDWDIEVVRALPLTAAHNLLSPIIAALFSGNGIVVKPSEHVAFTSFHLLRALRSCLSACGHDPDVVQVLTGCEADAAETLTGDERIRHIAFIGSDSVGRKVAERASGKGIQVCLELGGKVRSEFIVTGILRFVNGETWQDPAIVLDSADIDFFGHIFLRSAFQNAGQNCIGIERFLVHSSLYSRFIELVQPQIAALRPGSALSGSERADVGAMISPQAFDRLESLIEDAVKKGARVLVGGKRHVHDEFPQGHYFQVCPPSWVSRLTLTDKGSKGTPYSRRSLWM
jgi:acyl-CoA reductase-like NAD-dependent aldehyde dehydrogenase